MLIGKGKVEAQFETETQWGRAAWNGVFVYGESREGAESAEALLRDLAKDGADYTRMMGMYHMAVELGEKTVFFGDAAGGYRFFVDESAALACDSFLKLLDARGNFQTDGRSAEEFLALGEVYGGRTLDKNIGRSHPEKYYVLLDGKISAFDKKLPDVADDRRWDGLDGYLDDLLPRLAGKKIACVITGGVDSRMILACLAGRGVKPDLFVSGDESMADVRIARRIADALQLPITVIDGEIEGENDLLSAFEDADGQRDCAVRYRLTKMWKYLDAQGYDLCFGGVCGELYKNSFLNQDFPFYRGKSDGERFMKMKVLTGQVPESVRGEALDGDMAVEIRRMLEKNGPKSQVYFRTGRQVMWDRCTGTNNRRGRTACVIPLMETGVQAQAYRADPRSLEMHAFSRREVCRWAPCIADIPTERGLTCRIGLGAEMRDMGKNYVRLAKYGLKRLMRKQLKTTASMNPAILPRYEQAVRLCAEKAILKAGTPPQCVPAALRGAVLTLGLLLEKYAKEGHGENRPL